MLECGVGAKQTLTLSVAVEEASLTAERREAKKEEERNRMTFKSL